MEFDKSAIIFRGVLFLILFFASSSANSQMTVDFFPEKDNSIYAESNNSNALGDLFAGTNGSGNIRRALVKFDISSLPSDATITSVTLTLNKNKGTVSATSTIHKVLEDWGEGTSFAGGGGSMGTGGGSGASPTIGDATWNYQFWMTDPWTTNGGHFVATESASTTVTSSNGQYTWSSSTMTNDVQSWIDNPASNFGWIVRVNEGLSSTASRFNSSEDSQSVRPKLSVTYTLPPCPDTLELTGIIFGTHRANMLIRASGTVKDTSVAVFKTLGEVVLDPNFTVEQGGTFTIEQDGCN